MNHKGTDRPRRARSSREATCFGHEGPGFLTEAAHFGPEGPGFLAEAAYFGREGPGFLTEAAYFGREGHRLGSAGYDFR